MMDHACPHGVVARLARNFPTEVVHAPFPATHADIDLLNGWRAAQSAATTRTGFRRARLFRTRRKALRLEFGMRAPTPATFTFLVNTRTVGTAEIGAGWSAVAIDVTAVPEGDVFLVEFWREGEAADLDAACFEVRLPGARAGLREPLRVLARRVR